MRHVVVMTTTSSIGLVSVFFVDTFGPLLDGKDGPRLQNAVKRWARGASSCA